MNHLVAAKPLHLLFKAFAVALASLLLLSPAFAAGGNSVSLTWDPNPETNIAGYRLRFGTTSGTYPNSVDAGTLTTATATGLNQGTTYYFVVQAYNTAGQTGPASSEIAYTVPGAPNTAPSAGAFEFAVAEDGQIAVTLTGTDSEGDSLSFSITASPTKGTLTGTAPNLTYRPSANANGSDSFTYRVNDGLLDSAPATVSITITPVNDAPVAAPKSATTPEDTNVAITLSGTDVDGDTLSYQIVSAPTKGTFIGTAPNLTYRPAANLNGSDSFTYRVNDGTTDSAPATVSITISPVNDAPVAVAKSATTPEDTAVAITLSGTDVENSALTYNIATSPANGTLTGSPPNLTYTPNANFNGSDSFTYRAHDGSVNSAPATVSLTVSAVNDVPVAVARTVATSTNVAVAVTVTGTDADGNSLTYSLVTAPAHGTLSGTIPNLTYTPATGFSGSDSFTFRVNDGTTNSAAATVGITVGTLNTAPVAHGKSLSTMKNRPVAVLLTGSDADANAIAFRVVSQPAQGTLTGTAPNLTYTPPTGWTGDATFTYVANDGIVDSPAAQVQVKVKSKNRKPVATPGSATVHQNGSGTVLVAGTDADGDALSYVVVKPPAHGTIGGTGPNFTYTPAAGFRGTDRFTFAAKDGVAQSAAAAFSINVVNPHNRAPVADSGSLTMPAKKAAYVPMGGTDADGDMITFRIVSSPPTGKLSGKIPALKYKPAANFSGTVSFTYVVNDGTVDSAPATVTITVAAPVVTARSAGKAKAAGAVAGDALPILALRHDPARPGILMLEVTGNPGGTYTLQFSPDLGEWSDSSQLLLDDQGGLTLEKEIPNGSTRGFYRLLAP